MAMTGQRDAEGGGQVEVSVAVDVADVRPAGLVPEDGEPPTYEGDVPRLDRAQPARELPGAGSGRRYGDPGEPGAERKRAVQLDYPADSGSDPTAPAGPSGASADAATIPMMW